MTTLPMWFVPEILLEFHATVYCVTRAGFYSELRLLQIFNLRLMAEIGVTC